MTVHRVPRYGIFFSDLLRSGISGKKEQVRNLILIRLADTIKKNILLIARGRNGCDRMVVEFTTICAISAYHH